MTPALKGGAGGIVAALRAHQARPYPLLVAALAADDNLKAFAAREGVTIHTARFHLRTALTRTGTKTQSDLVHSAARLLRDMALRGQTK